MRYQHKYQLDWQSKYPNARSVILFAVPVPMLLLKFTYRGTDGEVIVPPGYSYSKIENKIEHLAKKVFGETGYDYKWLQGVSLKLLSVRSGLCLYGRNNITFCEGLGSFIQLYALATNMEAPDQAPWQAAARMPECEKCKVCAQVCPSNSIDLHAQIIHAERCLTYLNENGNEFPSWLESSAHNAMVGCMICQRACPQNRGYLTISTIENVFDEEDINAIFVQAESFVIYPKRPKKYLKLLILTITDLKPCHEICGYCLQNK